MFFSLSTHKRAAKCELAPRGGIRRRSQRNRNRDWTRSRFAVEALEQRSLLTFGTGGIVVTSVSNYDEALAVAIQPADQKIVAAGVTLAPNGAEDAFAAARYTTTGSLDTSFNKTGFASTTFNSAATDYGDIADAVAIMGSGDILAGGRAYTWNTKLGHFQSTFALASWKSNGALDKSFGTGGKVTTSFGTAESNVESLALTSSGQIVAMGIDSYVGTRVALARYNTDGSLDTTFGTSGTTLLDVKVTIGGSQYDFSPSAGILEPDGSILLAGSAENQVSLAHFSANGSLDTSFGTGGIITTAVGSSAGANSIALEPNGEVVVAGYSNSGSTLNFLVARYNTNGSLDTTFGGGLGYVTTNLGTDSVNCLVVQSNGQIVVVGQSSQAFTAVRYNSDGSLDSGFGTGGIVTTAIPATTRSAANAVTVQTNGQLVVAGQGSYYIQGPHGMQQNQEIVLVRYNTDGTLDSGSSQATPSLTISLPGADDSSLVPLAIDSPDFWNTMGLNKRSRRI
jgi:uncharacterized delta-60 repeat protein